MLKETENKELASSSFSFSRPTGRPSIICQEVESLKQVNRKFRQNFVKRIDLRMIEIYESGQNETTQGHTSAHVQLRSFKTIHSLI
jgi:hypothetical protein